MAILKYTELTTNSEMGLFDDDDIQFTKAGDTAARLDILDIQAASDAVRTLLAEHAGVPLNEYNNILADDLDDLDDRLDYYTYELAPINVQQLEGAWFSPIAIQSFCGEEIGLEAIKSIDGVNSTRWDHLTNEVHTLTWELRAYPKKVTKMRIRYGGAENVREQLNNITIKVAKNLGQIDNPKNIIATGVNPTWPIGQGATWVEINWSSPKARARYIKLEFGSAHGNNNSRIREIEFRVITRRPAEI